MRCSLPIPLPPFWQTAKQVIYKIKLFYGGTLTIQEISPLKLIPVSIINYIKVFIAILKVVHLETTHPTQRARDLGYAPCFQAVFLAQSWFRQNGGVSSR